jgi:hypothetical protein
MEGWMMEERKDERKAGWMEGRKDCRRRPVEHIGTITKKYHDKSSLARL